MTVYHFCLKKDIRGIRSDGLTRGAVPALETVGAPRGMKSVRVAIHAGWQWVTLDGDPEKQSWATNYLKTGDRRECRITIEIPDKELDCLHDADKLDEAIPGSKANLFEGWPESENWRVFRGNIPKYWFKKIEVRDEESKEWRDFREVL